MKFLAGMGISQSTVSWLREKELDAIHLREKGLHRISDAAIIKKAGEEGRVILTCDLDFGAVMAASGEIFPSIIIFRLENERPENVNKRLTQVLEESSHTLEKGAIISVEEKRHRISLLPI